MQHTEMTKRQVKKCGKESKERLNQEKFRFESWNNLLKRDFKNEDFLGKY
jgi:hypothetical protein